MVKRILQNFCIVLISLLLIILILEFSVFRSFLVASDLPMLQQNSGGVLKYIPNQVGTYRIRNEISSAFAINEQGWNTGHATYARKKSSNKPRICVIGDSYVEALQVPNRSSFAEIVERYLQPDVDSVYRFGLSGAPLSQYLYMLRNEVLQYSPDIVVINLVPNDFLESVVSGGGTYWSSFSTLVFDENGSLEVRAPKPYSRPPSWWLKATRTFRYLWVRQQVNPHVLKKIWMRLFDEGNAESAYVGNITLTSISDTRISKVIEYVFSEFGKFKRENGIELLILIDADRSNIQQSNTSLAPKESALATLHQLVDHFADANQLDLIDLSLVFSKDYKLNEVPFSFPNDGHWNQYAHRLVARVMGSFIDSMYLN